MIRISAFADEISQDPVEQIDVLTRHGIKAIEFRAIHGTNVLDLTDAQHAEFRDQLAASGIGLSAIGSPIGKIRITEPFEEHLDRFERAMDLAEFYGSPRIRIFSFYIPPGDDPASHREEVIHRMAELSRRAAARGITLFLENEKGIYGDTAARVADVLETVDSRALRACVRPGQLRRGPAADRRGLGPAAAPRHAFSRQGLRRAARTQRAGRRRRRPDPPPLAGGGRLRLRRFRGARAAPDASPGSRSGFTGPERFAEAVAALKGILDERNIPYE